MKKNRALKNFAASFPERYAP